MNPASTNRVSMDHHLSMDQLGMNQLGMDQVGMDQVGTVAGAEPDGGGLSPGDGGPAVRVAVFGSFYRGFHVLSELLKGPLAHRVEVVGVVTDDPGAGFVNRERRVWTYPHRVDEETMVEQLAGAHGLPVYKGRVKTEDFYRTYEHEWRPELCIAATFGQRIDARLHSLPRLGFFNLHPCIDDGWPSAYAGPNPFQALLDHGADHAVIALHEVDDGFDTGRLVALSEKVYFPPAATVVDLHKSTSPVAAKFLAQQLGNLLSASGRAQKRIS